MRNLLQNILLDGWWSLLLQKQEKFAIVEQAKVRVRKLASLLQNYFINLLKSKETFAITEQSLETRLPPAKLLY